MTQRDRSELVGVAEARAVLDRVNLLDESNSLAVDIGGNLAKLLYLAANGSKPLAIDRVRERVGSVSPLAVEVPALAGTLHFFAFETRCVEELVDFVGARWGNAERKVIRATGGGSYKYSRLFQDRIDVTLARLDEMKCAVAGLNFMLRYVDNEAYVYNSSSSSPPSTQVRPGATSGADCRRFIPRCDNPFPYLLVNVGSGVSIVKVTGHGQFERISGSALGGGTFWGLARLLLNCKTFDDVIALTNKGNHANVDMLVGDIYGGAYANLGLDADVIAASFGKVTMVNDDQRPPQTSWNAAKKAFIRAVRATWNVWIAVLLAIPIIGQILRWLGFVDPFSSKIANLALSPRFKAEDVALSLLRMVAYNIGQIAFLNARLHNLQNIYFGGNFVRNHPHTIADVSFAVDFWSQGTTKALFLKHDGYLGAVGAFIGGESASPEKHIPAEPKSNLNDKLSKCSTGNVRNRRKKSKTNEGSNMNQADKISDDDSRKVKNEPNGVGETKVNGDPGSTTTLPSANGNSKKRRKSRRAAQANGANANGVKLEANGKERGANNKANGKSESVAEYQMPSVYYDDHSDEAVRELIAGEWTTVTKRGKKKT